MMSRVLGPALVAGCLAAVPALSLEAPTGVLSIGYSRLTDEFGASDRSLSKSFVAGRLESPLVFGFGAQADLAYGTFDTSELDGTS